MFRNTSPSFIPHRSSFIVLKLQTSDLIYYLRAFNRPERSDLRRFVASPWFNRRDDVLRLLDVAEQQLQGRGTDALHSETAWAAVFPGEPFSVKEWGYVQSYLLALVKRWLALREMTRDPEPEQMHLCRALKRAGLDDYFEREMQRLRKMQENSSIRNAAWHLHEYDYFAENQDFIARRKRGKTMDLAPVGAGLSTFFMAELLRWACAAESLRTVTNQPYTLPILPEVLAHVEAANGMPGVPAVAVYYRCYRALCGSEVDFTAFRQLLTAHWQQFSTAEMRDLWLLAVNYCIRRLNTGDRTFVRTAFDLYREGMDNGILLEDGFLSAFTYKNITRLGLGLQEYEWVEQFLDAAKQYLEPRIRENTHRYNLAFFHFHRKEYAAAMQLLVRTELDDVYNQLDARHLLLVCYYELSEWDALGSLLDSFASYLKRQKNIGYQRDNYENLIRFTRQLLELKPGDAAALAKLQADISRTPLLAGKEWLSGKV